MQTPRSRGPRRFFRVVTFLAVVTIVSGLGSALLPAVDRVALAAEGQALGDTLILAGPGGQYGIHAQRFADDASWTLGENEASGETSDIEHDGASAPE